MVSLRNRDFCGPFHTYEAFLKRFYDSFRCTVAAHSTRDGTKKDDIPANASLYASIFFDNISMDAKAYESKLTHGDLQLHNIIFVSPSNGLDKVEDLDPVLIDWETLAWMPAWAEVTRILHEFGSSTHHFRDLMAFSKEIRPFLLADAEYAMHMSDATGLVGFI